jgi:hypothetical protein
MSRAEHDYEVSCECGAPRPGSRPTKADDDGMSTCLGPGGKDLRDRPTGTPALRVGASALRICRRG